MIKESVASAIKTKKSNQIRQFIVETINSSLDEAGFMNKMKNAVGLNNGAKETIKSIDYSLESIKEFKNDGSQGPGATGAGALILKTFRMLHWKKSSDYEDYKPTIQALEDGIKEQYAFKAFLGGATKDQRYEGLFSQMPAVIKNLQDAFKTGTNWYVAAPSQNNNGRKQTNQTPATLNSEFADGLEQACQQFVSAVDNLEKGLQAYKQELESKINA